MERLRACDEAKAKEKAKVSRIAAEAREKAVVRVKPNTVQRALVEAVSNIRSREEA